MPPKTIKLALLDALEDLSKQDFDKFCHRLVDRRESPRVRRSRVEDQTFTRIVDVLVSTFTESGALQVAVETLTQIGCNQEAQTLGESDVVTSCCRYDVHFLVFFKSSCYVLFRWSD